MGEVKGFTEHLQRQVKAERLAGPVVEALGDTPIWDVEPDSINWTAAASIAEVRTPSEETKALVVKIVARRQLRAAHPTNPLHGLPSA